MGGALVAATIALRLWRANWHVPFIGGIDGPSATAAVKSVVQNGWYLNNPNLGAPQGQHLADFAGFTGDSLQWAFIKVLGWGIGSAPLLANLWYVLGYALVAGAAYLALRYFRITPGVALVAAIVFAILPYHFARGAAGHLTLANYMAVPAGCVLVLRVLLGRPFMVRRISAVGWRQRVTPENLGVGAACIVVGLASLYYAVFTLMLLVFAALLRWAASGRWRDLVPATIAFGVTGVLLGINLLPGLLARLTDGPNPLAAVRTPAESEVYSLTFTELLMPVQQHVIGPLANLRARFDANQVVRNEPGWELGLLLSGAFVVGLVLLVVWALRRRSERPGMLPAAAATGAFVAFLIATFGGISELIAHLISPEIRVWSRLTPFIAFFALVLLALGLQWLVRRLRQRTGGIWGGAVVLLLVAIVALVDQTSPTFIPTYEADAASWNSADDFVQRIEATTGADAMILQLPFHAFPESGPTGGMNDYDQLAGYLHSDTLRWSYGAMKGRPDDWTSAQATLPMPVLIPAAAAAGFAGVWVDLAAYPDHGAAVVAQVRAAADPGAPYFTSSDDRRAFVGLSPLTVRLRASHSAARLHAAGQALVAPSVVTYGNGFYPQEADATHYWYWAQSTATLAVTNPTSAARALRLDVGLRTSPGATVIVTSGGRAVAKPNMATGTARLRLPLSVPPGGEEITFTTSGSNLAAPGDARGLFLQLASPTLRDPALIIRP